MPRERTAWLEKAALGCSMPHLKAGRGQHGQRNVFLGRGWRGHLNLFHEEGAKMCPTFLTLVPGGLQVDSDATEKMQPTLSNWGQSAFACGLKPHVSETLKSLSSHEHSIFVSIWRICGLLPLS